jgi:hypothetical protein
MPKVYLLHHKTTLEHLGFIPLWLKDNDPTPLALQLDRCYSHGGGWKPFDVVTLNRTSYALEYPGDPPLYPIAMIEVEGHQEKVLMYESAWVAILWPNFTFEVCRMD